MRAPVVSMLSQKTQKGFSLVEVVLALGIVSFAIMGIIGLFPVAMRSAQESQRETRAAVIAQQIFSDLKCFPGTNTFLVRGPSANNAASVITGINLSSSNNYVLAYDSQGTGLSNVISASSFSNSITTANAAFVAQVQLSPNTPTNGLCRVQTTIETPAAASSTYRSRYVFVTLLNQN